MRFGAVPRLAALAVAAAFILPGSAQAQITRGAVSGTVRDASGAVVPGVSVTATNVATNAARTSVSDAQGFYRIPALEPGTYTVRAELSGFQKVEIKDVPVRTSSEVSLNVDMKVATTAETITVEGKNEAIELNKTNPTVGMTATARQVVELPLGAARNINNLVLLAPNTGSTAGQGGITANGQRSRNNNYMIDGSDNNDISVTIPTTPVVPESVAEFQVQTNSYSTEFGRNSGAQVNVITKSGTNAFHGEVWDYYRNSDFYSLTNIQKAAGLTEQSPFTRHQAGASIGGPIIKDKTFFFLLYQYDGQRPGETPGATVRIPTPAGYAALQSVPLRAGQTTASRQAVLQRLSFLQNLYGQNLSFRSLSNITVNGVPIETGQTNVLITQPSTYHTLNARVDHRLGDNDNLTLRYYYVKRDDKDQVSNCVFGPLFCGSQALKDTNFALSETHIFSSTAVNEFRFSWVKRDLTFPENDPASPTASIAGLFTVGGASNFPQGRITDSFQFSDTLTWTKNRHTVKFGADIRYNKAFNDSRFNSKGTFAFNSLQDFMNNTAFSFQQAVSTASWDARQWQSFFFIQDDFRITPNFTLNLGIRYELSDVPFGMFGATDAQSRAALVPGPAKKDTNNWAPRVGFNWSPSSSNKLIGDGKTVVRGGFGVAYDVIFYNLLTVNGSNYPRIFNFVANNVLDQYPNILPSASGAPTFNPLAGWVNSPEDLENPESRYWSLSVGREIGDFVVEAGYTGSRSYKGINQVVANPAILTDAQAALVRSTLNPNAIPGIQARSLFPQFGPRTLIPAYVGPAGNDVEARSEYNAGYISVNKRLSRGIQFGINYTFSKWMSNNDASLGEGGTGASSQRPQSMFDYEAEWSRSNFDRPHRFVTNYIWELPGPKSGILRQIIGGWQLSGITEFQSGGPFTILTGVDTSGDGNTGSDRPSLGSGTFDWDDEHKNFVNNGRYVVPRAANGTPLVNSGNGNAARNSERGASYWNTDLSLMKRFFIGKRQLVVRADLLNAFNQDAYGIPNNNMASPSFGINGNNWGQRTMTFSGKFIF